MLRRNRSLPIASALFSAISLVGCADPDAAEAARLAPPAAHESAGPPAAAVADGSPAALADERPAQPSPAEVAPTPASREPAAREPAGVKPIDSSASGAALSAPSADGALMPVPAGTPVKQEGPLLLVDRLFHDFGQIWDIEVKHCTFTLRNAGSEPVTIRDIKTECGCTVPEKLAKDVIEPGEEVPLRIRYTPKKGSSEQKRHIDIISNDPAERRTVEIRAQVIKFAALDPSSIELGEVQLGVEHGTQAKVLTYGGALEITSIDTEVVSNAVPKGGDYMTATLVPGSQPPQIDIKLTDKAPWGKSFGTVTVHCRAQVEGRSEWIEHDLITQLRALVFGELHSSDNAFQLGYVPPGTSFEKTIRFWRPSKAPFKLEARVTETTFEGLRVDVTPASDDQGGYDVTVRGETGTFEGPIGGLVEITTDLPKETGIAMRFGGLVREPPAQPAAHEHTHSTAEPNG